MTQSNPTLLYTVLKSVNSTPESNYKSIRLTHRLSPGPASGTAPVPPRFTRAAGLCPSLTDAQILGIAPKFFRIAFIFLICGALARD